MAVFDTKVWIGSGNTFKLLLTSKKAGEDVAPSELDLVDQMDLELRATDGTITTITAMNNDADSPIDWWHADLAPGEVQFRLGVWAETSGPSGGTFPTGKYEARLSLYSATVNEGLKTVWLSWANNDLSISFFL